MDFDFSFEQQMIAKSVSRVLADLPPVMDRPPFPYSAAGLSARFSELGIFPDDPADPVLGFADAVAVAIEVGRALPAGPLVEQLAASFLISEAAASSMAVSGCLCNSAGGLTGRVLVPFAGDATRVLVPVIDGGRRIWQMFEMDDLAVEEVETTDIATTASWAFVKPGRTSAPLADQGKVSPDDILQLLVLAEMTGCAESVLEKTVTYVAERRQFGKPIGTNQAIKHLAADTVSDVEIMKAAVEYAGWALDEAGSGGDGGAHDEARIALLTARSFIGEHARLVMERCVQMHGGIAFTWDYRMHRYLRRILYRTGTIIRPMESREALACDLLENT